MAKKMLIEATQEEQTRVAVIDGNRLDELDFEVESRKQLKGNIYLAKVTRVEPSLQAAFVEYGGNRHGFLAFAEIHPDYYKIPVADKEKLLELERELEREEAEREEAEEAAMLRRRESQTAETTTEISVLPPTADLSEDDVSKTDENQAQDNRATAHSREQDPSTPETDAPAIALHATEAPESISESLDASLVETSSSDNAGFTGEQTTDPSTDHHESTTDESTVASTEKNGSNNNDEAEEDVDRRRFARRRAALLRQYKIQEVIKRNQILLIQVVKEERGNKGAALTTYLSLAGRYCVLMPNTNRGGGVSRKISSVEERRRMKTMLSQLDLQEGMSVILRTAGLERSISDIRRDLEYVMRLWDSIREKTLSSTAPSLIHEEANLIRRAVRDLYSRDVSEILVEGETGYQMAREFMKMIMPAAARRVKLYRDPAVPLFVRHRIESQIEALYTTTVHMKSGAYLVINQTEALVAIDVNSGRATRERNIEETALRTNLEAADEIARQLRLRDMAGLVVIDFIDMEEQRHNSAVERRMREAMKNDRARIQIGRISMFGLLELSRQRLRPSLIETNFTVCSACGGMGHTRSVESAALHVLRTIEEEGLQQKASEIAVNVADDVALYLLNHKRDTIGDVERRYGIKIYVHAEPELRCGDIKIDRLKSRQAGEFKLPDPPPPLIEDDSDLPPEEEETDSEENNDRSRKRPDSDTDDNSDRNGRRRRGGRSRTSRNKKPSSDEQSTRSKDYPDVSQPGAPQPDLPPTLRMLHEDDDTSHPQTENERNGNEKNVSGEIEAESGSPDQEENASDINNENKRRRRGRRGGRGRTRNGTSPASTRDEANSGDTTSEEKSLAQEEKPDTSNNGNQTTEGQRTKAPSRRPRRSSKAATVENVREENPANDEGNSSHAPLADTNPATPNNTSGTGGIKILTEIKGRSDNNHVPAVSTTAMMASASPPNTTAATGTDTAAKPKSGWWKRLIRNAEGT